MSVLQALVDTLHHRRSLPSVEYCSGIQPIANATISVSVSSSSSSSSTPPINSNHTPHNNNTGKVYVYASVDTLLNTYKAILSGKLPVYRDSLDENESSSPSPTSLSSSSSFSSSQHVQDIAYIHASLWMKPKNEFKRVIYYHLACAHRVVFYEPTSGGMSALAQWLS
jgi:hypothetical protein